MQKSDGITRSEATVTRTGQRKHSDVYKAIHTIDRQLAAETGYQQDDVQCSAADIAAAENAVRENRFGWTQVINCGA